MQYFETEVRIAIKLAASTRSLSADEAASYVLRFLVPGLKEDMDPPPDAWAGLVRHEVDRLGSRTSKEDAMRTLVHRLRSLVFKLQFEQTSSPVSHLSSCSCFDPPRHEAGTHKRAFSLAASDDLNRAKKLLFSGRGLPVSPAIGPASVHLLEPSPSRPRSPPALPPARVQALGKRMRADSL
jgi:hypothetical protein